MFDLFGSEDSLKGVYKIKKQDRSIFDKILDPEDDDEDPFN
jgi:predicted transcriptional regulator